jgi:predicted nucleic-acid-binding Zn-ribbon protein
MNCPKCELVDYVKSGFKGDKQRYKCRKCGCNFTQGHLRAYSFKLKLQAVKLYLEGVGFRSIGRILGISNVTALHWIRQFGKVVKHHVQTQLPDDIHDIEVIEIDEMWHFTQKKAANSGYGLRLSEPRKESLDFRWTVVVEKPLNPS